MLKMSAMAQRKNNNINKISLHYSVQPGFPNFVFLFLLLSLLLFFETTTAQRTRSPPLTNDGLRQAVDLWLSNDDHDRAEVLALLGPMDTWDTSQVTSLAGLFRGKSQFSSLDIAYWNTSRVTDMSDVFNGCTRFNEPLLWWDWTLVTSTARMFKGATRFQQDLTGINTARVTDMSAMFQGASAFRGEGLETWDVSNVRLMNDMFVRATNFNANISGWNTNNVESMESMFVNAVSFNQDLSFWNLQRVVSIENMFRGATRFNQTLCWDTLPQSTRVNGMFCNSHANAHLDPCCVNSVSLLQDSCCDDEGEEEGVSSSGRCNNLVCPGIVNGQTVEPASNDDPSSQPPTQPEESEQQQEQEIQQQQQQQPSPSTTENDNNNNNGVTATPDGPPANPPSSSGSTNNAASESTTENPNNLQSDGGTSNEAANANVVDNDSEDGNIWQRFLWLRILIPVFVLLVIGILFMDYLARRSDRRNMERAAAYSSKSNKRGDEEQAAVGKGTELTQAKTKDSAEDYDDYVDAKDCTIPKVTRIH